jgi:hypothetical protein
LEILQGMWCLVLQKNKELQLLQDFAGHVVFGAAEK